MKPVIHQPFGNVFDLDAGGLFELPQVDDALVSDQPALTAVKDWIKPLQSLGDIVGIRDGDFRGMGEAGGTHQRNVGPRNAQDACAAVRSRRDRTDDRGAPEIREGMGW